LIDAIVLTPEDDELSVYLRGDLAGILTLAQNKTKPLARVAMGSGVLAQQVSLVAGVGFEPTTFSYEPDDSASSGQHLSFVESCFFTCAREGCQGLAATILVAGWLGGGFRNLA
jgi:hypothetical protein